MKIQSLEIENLACFHGVHRVHFNQENLGEGLFAITGPTGAGKSSLLNGISLALYGKTYKTWLRQSDYVTLGQHRARVRLSFEFKAQNYTAAWECRLAKKDGQKLKSPVLQRVLFKGPEALEIDAEQLLGIDFDQFTKSVILNQGEFSRYLLSHFSERKNILERLYQGENLATLGRTLNLLLKNNSQNIKQLERQKSELSQQELPRGDFLEKQIQANTEQKNQFENDLKLLSASLKTHEDRQKLAKDYKKNQSKTQELKLKLEGLNQQTEKGLSLHQKALEQLEQDKLQFQEKLPQLIEAEKLQDKILETQKTYQKALQEYSPLSQRLENLQKELRSAEISIEQLKKNQKALLSTREKIKLKASQAQNLWEAYQRHQTSIQDFFDSQQLSDQLKEKASAQQQQLKQLEDKLLDLEVQISTFQKQHSTLPRLEQKLHALIEALQTFKHLLQQSTTQGHQAQKLEEQIKTLEQEQFKIQLHLPELEQWSHLQLTPDFLQSYINSIHQQHRCPLCDQEVDSTRLKQRENALRSVETHKIQLFQELELRKKEHQQERQIILKHIQQAHKNMSALIQKWSFIDSQDRAQAQLEDKIQKTKRQVDELSALIRKKNIWQTEYAALKKFVQQYQEQVKSAQARSEKFQLTFQDLWQKLIQQYPNSPQNHQLIQQFKEEYYWLGKFKTSQLHLETTQENLSLKQDQTQQTQKKQLELETHIQSLQECLKQFQTQLQALVGDQSPIVLKKQWQTRIEQSQEREKLSAKKVHEYEIQRNQQKAYIQQLQEQTADLYSLQLLKAQQWLDTLQELREQVTHNRPSWFLLPSTSVDKLSPNALLQLETGLLHTFQDQCLQLQKKLIQEIEQRVEELGKMRAQLEMANKLKQQKKQLEQQLAKQLDFQNRLDNLQSFIGKEDFRNFALGLVEEILLAKTNAELSSLCDGRYRLLRGAHRAGQEFIILDRHKMNQKRRVSTLSGGETFMVSLALSLGLSEMNRGQMHLETLFIDEGFGQLDEECLDEVLEVLYRLQSRGKSIGVISHIKTLTDRIPANIQLVKSYQGRSQIQISSFV